MVDNYVSKEIKRLEKLKNQIKEGSVKITELTKEDSYMLNVLYEMESTEIENEIDDLDKKLEKYKKRMKKAIEYLKSKKK